MGDQILGAAAMNFSIVEKLHLQIHGLRVLLVPSDGYFFCLLNPGIPQRKRPGKEPGSIA